MVMFANLSALLAGIILLNYFYILRNNRSILELLNGPNNQNEKRNLKMGFQDERDLYENFS